MLATRPRVWEALRELGRRPSRRRPTSRCAGASLRSPATSATSGPPPPASDALVFERGADAIAHRAAESERDARRPATGRQLPRPGGAARGASARRRPSGSAVGRPRSGDADRPGRRRRPRLRARAMPCSEACCGGGRRSTASIGQQLFAASPRRLRPRGGTGRRRLTSRYVRRERSPTEPAPRRRLATACRRRPGEYLDAVARSPWASTRRPAATAGRPTSGRAPSPGDRRRHRRARCARRRAAPAGGRQGQRRLPTGVPRPVDLGPTTQRARPPRRPARSRRAGRRRGAPPSPPSSPHWRGVGRQSCTKR